MSSQTILQQPTLLENASKHRAYHETDISTWYRAGTQDFIEGDINLGYVKYPDPTGKRAFDLKEFNEKKEKITNPLEKAVLGWKGEHLNERQKYVEETARAAKEDRLADDTRRRLYRGAGDARTEDLRRLVRQLPRRRPVRRRPDACAGRQGLQRRRERSGDERSVRSHARDHAGGQAGNADDGANCGRDRIPAAEG